MDTSILFSNVKKDSNALYDSCFNFDIELIDLASFTKTREELDECHYTLKSFYSHFIKMFTVLSAHSASFPLIDRSRFELFCHIMKVTPITLPLVRCFEIYD